MNASMFRALVAGRNSIASSRILNTAQLTVRWIAHQMAGHDIHHLQQIESVVGD